MIFYPKLYLNNVKEITVEILNQNKIKGLILDVDNTLIDFDKKLLEGTEKWVNTLKEAGIKLCIVSNTNHKEKVENVANALDIPYIYFAKKPCKGGFKRAQNVLNMEESEIAVVGDQIFTDVLGGNRVKMFPILVKPIDKRDIWATRFKRPIEKVVIKKYVKKNNLKMEV